MVLLARALAVAASSVAGSAAAPAAAAEGGVVAVAEFIRFAQQCVQKVGARAEHGALLAEVLAEADRRGHYSHGLNRLEMYVNELRDGICDGNADPCVLSQQAGTAWVDGKNALGPVIGRFCMDLAIQKAREAGVGYVAAKGANHFGIAAYYSNLASKQGMIGMAITNTSPLMGPTRSKEGALGTNPIAISAPAAGGDSFELDMATTAVALGKIELSQRLEKELPEGWAQDASGAITTDPQAALDAKVLMPLGGAEHTSGYKGYGLSLAVEVLGAALAGGTMGPYVRRWASDEMRPADLGHAFLVINTACFAPGYQERLGDLLGRLRALEPVEPGKNVLVPGDPERVHTDKVDKQDGMLYHPNQLAAADELASYLGVTPMCRRDPSST